MDAVFDAPTITSFEPDGSSAFYDSVIAVRR
jgi:hypothetical protein